MSESYRASRRQVLTRLLDGRHPAELTADDVEAWYTGLEIDPGSMALYMSHAVQFWRWLIERRIVDEDATRLLRRPKPPTYEPRPIDRDELDWALAMARGDVRLMLHVMAYTGARCTEVARLRSEDIRHDDAPPVIVLRGKGRKERTVPLHPRLAEVLRDAEVLGGRGEVFWMPSGKPAHARHVSRSVNVFLHAIGVDATAHQIRHRWITDVQRATGDTMVTARLAGHSSPAHTFRYAQTSDTAAVAAVLTLD